MGADNQAHNIYIPFGPILHIWKYNTNYNSCHITIASSLKIWARMTFQTKEPITIFFITRDDVLSIPKL